MLTWSAWLLVAYCMLITAASWIGGEVPSRLRLNHRSMQVLMSFVAGFMLGVSLLQMLPHAAMHLPSIEWAVGAVLAGLLAMFFLIRVFHFHQHHGHDEPLSVSDRSDSGSELLAVLDSSPGAGGCSHGHSHASHHDPARLEMSWTGLALGLSIHTLIDGMALGASVAAESTTQNDATLTGLAGVGTFLAILFHKPLDSMSIATLMSAAGWSRLRQRLVNCGFAMMCPLGALLFLAGTRLHVGTQHELLGLALAFSAGVFLCISLGDLLPEVHFHQHDRLKLSVALLLGVGLAVLSGFLEPVH
jgi:zinc and cadmium transporter